MGVVEASPTADVVRDIFVTTALSINSLLFVLHFYMIWFVGEKDARFHLTTILSFLSIFSAIVYNVILMCYSYSFLNDLLSCRWQLVLVLLFYLYNKCSLYIFQLERLFMIFIDSAYKFSPFFTRTSRGLLLSIVIVLSILCIIFGDPTTGEYGTNECSSNHPAWLNALAVLVDIGFLTVIWIVLSRRLLMLLNAMNVFSAPATLTVEVSDLSSKQPVDSCLGRTVTDTLTIPTRSPSPVPDLVNDESPSYQHYKSAASTSITMDTLDPVPSPDTHRGHLGARAPTLSNSMTLPDLQSVDSTSRKVGQLTVSRSMSVKPKSREKKVNPATKIYNVLKRNSILTVAALLTTNISIVMAVVIGVSTAWTSVDSVVNCVCVMLMFTVHEKAYKGICGYLER